VTTANVLLGVLAFASVAQAVSLVILFWQGRKVVLGLEETAAQVGKGLMPTITNLTRTTEALAETTAVTSAQLRRLDEVVTGLSRKVEQARDVVDEVMVPSAVKVVALTAAVGIVRRTLRTLRGRGGR
jgi:hypothetical protein